MLQPNEIQDMTFKKGLFGYKADEVDQFKRTVYNSYSDLLAAKAAVEDELAKIKKSQEESRLKIYDLETKLQQAGGGDDAKKQAEKIIADAKKEAAEIIAKAKGESGKGADTTAKKEETKVEVKKEEPKKEEPKKEEPKKEDEKGSAASKFFKKAEEEAFAAVDDDEIFVGEIEDNRKPNKMMIGDGEEEDDGDFEFL